MARTLLEIENQLEDYARWTREAQSDDSDPTQCISIQDMDADLLEEAAEIIWQYRTLE